MATKFVTKDWTEKQLKAMDKDFLEKKYLQIEDFEADIAKVMEMKGVVETEANLPLTGNRVGDVYAVKATNDEYVWIEQMVSGAKVGSWEPLGSMSSIEVEKSDIDFSKWIATPSI